jgi:hypothetical protein
MLPKASMETVFLSLARCNNCFRDHVYLYFRSDDNLVAVLRRTLPVFTIETTWLPFHVVSLSTSLGSPIHPIDRCQKNLERSGLFPLDEQRTV